MKFTEQERDFLKQEFADLCHAAINSMITAGSFVRAIDRIEQIVSERLTIKPYHEHGNSVASDRTEPGESGQSAEDVLKGLLNRGMYEFSYSANECLQAMHTYASQVCADKEYHISELNRVLDIGKNTISELRSELDKANESLTVMIRKNAELEKELEFKRLA